MGISSPPKVLLARSLSLLAWLFADAALSACPEVDYPPGIDVGAATVEAILEVGADGAVTALRWSGPDPLVAAVSATLDRCVLPGPGTSSWSWRFAEPPVNVSGEVRSRGDRAPVRTTVAIGDRVARTDGEGRFALRNVAPGPSAVRIADPAWRLGSDVRVEIPADGAVEIEVWVLPDRGSADELVATYDRSSPVGVVRTVALERARAIPGTMGDPLRALASEPGLTRSPYDAGWLLVRGGEYDEVGLFLDGVRVPLVYHLGGFTSVLHPEMVETIRFWPGLFPARYGDAISGAVDLVPRAPGDRPRAVGGLNLVFAHAYAETPTRFGAVAIAARRSWLDGVLAVALGREEARIAPRFWDLSSQIRVGRARFLALVLRDRIDAPSFSGGGILSIEQDAAQLQGVIPVGDAVEIRPFLAWTRQGLTGDDVTPQQVDELYPGMRIEGRAEPVGADATGGLEIQRRLFRLDKDHIVRTSPTWQIEPYVGLSVGDTVRGWTEARLATLVVEDDPRQPLRAALSPRAGVQWRPRGALELHGAFGRLHQPPPPTLMLPVSEGAYLPLEQSEQISVGGAWREGSVALDADLWVRGASNLGEIELDNSIGPAQGRAYGLESRLRFARDGFDGTVLYQLTRSLEREDPGDRWRPGAFDAPHRVELLLIQHLPRAWTGSARFRWNSGYARTLGPDPYGLGLGLLPTEAYDMLRQETTTLGLLETDLRLAPFHALDLRIGRLFSMARWQIEVALDVQNVYSRRVVEPVISGFGESRPSYGFGLPILPIFSVDAKLWPRP